MQQQPRPDLVVEFSPRESVMRLLQQHVPLSLLVDLSLPECPDSEEILAEERWQGDTSWADRRSF
ncbi:hypothetical protein SAMN06264364_14024 [Quadrisphaera granulorum]|uniref:Uncharacterized protein n=1 Tax=Quadrisphaera granulorum TaxID=317664 RepID=A0A315ZQF0_9ACTN|nr:hypothetical protein [Quadrisphaera granulorum]PWJ47210.1 hypothetical protein BXY45_14024 [Quadrisphaera granulorum]SZE98896.1 hypothetical protein SAMN06264364_14024 [Quadrisphaera granulorum]